MTKAITTLIAFSDKFNGIIKLTESEIHKQNIKFICTRTYLQPRDAKREYWNLFASLEDAEETRKRIFEKYEKGDRLPVKSNYKMRYLKLTK